MTVRRLLLTLTPLLILCLCAAPAPAETVVEAWRSPFGYASSVSVNPTDGSCWSAAGGSVMHLAADGTILSQSNGFRRVQSVSVNPTDGSCWVADYDNNHVVHLAENGSELWRGGGFSQPWSVSVNPTDASCWVADTGNDQVVHLAEDGTELWRGGGFNYPFGVSANPTDNSCWVADRSNNQIVHLAEDGTELWRGGGFNYPYSVSVNPTDNSCWVADTNSSQIVHLAEDGTELWRGGGFNYPYSVSVNSADDSCWVADRNNSQIVHLAEDGTEVWRGGGFNEPYSVSVNPTDNSCWVADYGNDQVVHLAENGTELWRGGGFYWPSSVSVNPTDGSCWVADTYNDQVVHLAEDGTELWRSGGFNEPMSVSVNPTDDSCWVADYYNNQVVHLAEDGSELWRGGGFNRPCSVSVNPTDGSCWVADYQNYQVVHLAEDGAELWRGGGFTQPSSVSVNPSDGSCWVADYFDLVHLAEDGAELWSDWAFHDSHSVSVNPADGSCWVADYYNNQVVHLAEDGSELWRGGAFWEPYSVSVNPTDGSCWVADTNNYQVVHLGEDGAELWRGGGFYWPTSVSVNPTDGSCWVADTGNNQVVHLMPNYRTLSLSGTGGTVRVKDVSRSLPWSGKFHDGCLVELEAVPDPCYEFTGWSGDLAGSENPTLITIDGDKSITANFAFMQHPLDLTAAGSGSVEVDGVPHSLPWSDIYDCGPTVALEAVPDTGWVFIAWSGDLTGADNPTAITVDLDRGVTASFALHTFDITADPPSPPTVVSGGAADLSIILSDSGTHAISSCYWNDGGAGGAFSPSPNVQNPTYTAPANTGDAPVLIPLTVWAICDGWEPLGDAGSTVLTVLPVEHTIEVYASALPSTVESEGTTDLTANSSDSRTHGIASWSWNDGGAGGTFTPSADVQNPTYTAPENTEDTDLFIPLTVLVTCDGPDPLSDSDATLLIVHPVPLLAVPQVLLEVHPNERAPGVAGPLLGDPYWTPPGASGTGGYTWKTYNFAGSPYLWIQVCAQAQRASNTPSGIADRLQMLVDGVYVADYWADNMAALPSYQWDGNFALDMGRRKTLRFLSMGIAGVHSIRFKAVQYPILWWIKVTDLEPGVIEPPG